MLPAAVKIIPPHGRLHQAQGESASGRDAFSEQPAAFKRALEPGRARALRAAVRGDGGGGGMMKQLNAHKLAPQLRTFILEHLTPSGADTYKPEWPLLEGLLEVLDPPELEEWWESLRPLQLRVGEACGFWQLLMGDIAAGNRGHAAGGSARAADLGTMASRFEQQQGEGMHEPEPETK